MARDNRDRDRGGDRDRDDRGSARRRDFAHNILEAIGERGGEIFGANVGGFLKNRTVAKVAQFFGESGISPDFVLNNLPYITTLPILNDFFNESAEGVLRGLAEHMRARLAAMPTDPDQQKVWIAKELDAYKGEAKKSIKSPTAATQHLFQVVAGLDEELRKKFDEMLLALPVDGDGFTQAKVLDEGRKRVVTRDEIVAIITTSDARLRMSKLEGLLEGAPLVNPPKKGLAAFADELTGEATGQAKGLKPDGKYVEAFKKDAKKSAKRAGLAGDAIDGLLKRPSPQRSLIEAFRRFFL
jgi:hypothetical protein